jgi:hypothetical protein
MFIEPVHHLGPRSVRTGTTLALPVSLLTELGEIILRGAGTINVAVLADLRPERPTV